jgi:hypothetical protein
MFGVASYTISVADLPYFMKQLKDNIETSGTVSYKSIIPTQGNLKSLSGDNYLKLKSSFIEHGFIVPILVWEKKGLAEFLSDAKLTWKLAEQVMCFPKFDFNQEKDKQTKDITNKKLKTCPRCKHEY